MPSTGRLEPVLPGLYRFTDTCNVYLLVRENAGERTAVAVDFGAGDILDHLAEVGVDRITDVLMTHHHRDQAQGLPRAVRHGADIHVPPVEVELFDRVEDMWQSRPISNDYNVRQDRFSLLESVPVSSTVPEYRAARYAGVEIRTVPTPGHTVGSVTYLAEVAGQTVAFSGDLIFAPGKVWSLAACEWSYSSMEGPAMAALSCYLLMREQPALLLPSHGDPMGDPQHALGLLARNLQRYVDCRLPEPWDLRAQLDDPYLSISDHLLLNRSSHSCSYVVRSETGEALFIDYGYDMTTGVLQSSDRSSRRPWLASIPALKQRHQVTRVGVVLPTHYHDDHVAGMPLLREIEGTQIWSPRSVAIALTRPHDHDLPCQWYDPIVPDRLIDVGDKISWNEYTITVHDQPGHTLYAVAYEIEIDGARVLFTGDQQDNMDSRAWRATFSGQARNENLDPDRRRSGANYQYRNRFRVGDYQASAALYAKIAPHLLASGHWIPRPVDDELLAHLSHQGNEVADIHRTLLPLDTYHMDADSIFARLSPYHSSVPAGSRLTLTATVLNPFNHTVELVLRVVAPSGWRGPDDLRCWLAPRERRSIALPIDANDVASRRRRVAVDVTIGELRLGQHAEALVDVTLSGDRSARGSLQRVE